MKFSAISSTKYYMEPYKMKIYHLDDIFLLLLPLSIFRNTVTKLLKTRFVLE